MSNMESKIEEAIGGLGASSYRKLLPYEDYEVYEPIYSGKGGCIGYPYVVLVKGDKICYSTEEESLKILDLNYPDEEEVENA